MRRSQTPCPQVLEALSNLIFLAIGIYHLARGKREAERYGTAHEFPATPHFIVPVIVSPQYCWNIGKMKSNSDLAGAGSGAGFVGLCAAGASDGDLQSQPRLPLHRLESCLPLHLLPRYSHSLPCSSSALDGPGLCSPDLDVVGAGGAAGALRPGSGSPAGRRATRRLHRIGPPTRTHRRLSRPLRPIPHLRLPPRCLFQGPSGPSATLLSRFKDGEGRQRKPKSI